MEYFCVFTKKGELIHSQGTKPPYLNSLISSLDALKRKQARAVQDHFMFCEIKKEIVYLSIQKHKNEDILSKEIERYECIEQPDKEEVKIKQASVKQRKWDNEEYDPALDFSSAVGQDEMKTESEAGIETFYSAQPKKTGKHKNKANLIKNKESVIIANGPSKKYTFNLFRKRIDKEELRIKMEDHLVNKNVSHEITEEVVNSVLSSFQETVNEREFKDRMKDVIRNMIKSINHEELLKTIKKTKLFVFCFVGVNGVGKSTSLAKICCWLLQNNLRVYIAACDTFRAGAIEQLKVHVQRFKEGGYEVGFYEKGYNKDDAGVAKSAIRDARENNYDVVLIDTAGRMSNKKNLMESLSKIIRVNEINHIIFVGEALLGNDSLEHLREFNKAVSLGRQGRCIDSLFVSKIDTVDDKIGQILNMSVGGECPVLFLGTGQTNTSLSVLNVDLIVDSLLS